jgi:polyhydroxybutyrate depolymerase
MGTKGRWGVVGGGALAAVAVALAVTLRGGSHPAPLSGPPTWVTTSVGVTVDGIARRYVLVRPAAVSKTALPVMVVLHGRIVTPEFEEQRTGFPGIVGPAILVYPAGYQNSWNAGACCAGAQAAGVDDVAFVTDVVHRVLATQPDAAADRVFLVGFSNGGKMVFRLACAEPGLFDGAAVVGAVPVSSCAHPPALPFVELAIHDDPLLTLTPAQPPKAVNGFPQASVEGEVATLRTANGCRGDGRREVQGTLTVTRWTDCRTGKPVELALYQGRAHVWPAGDATTPSAGQVIWNFFRSIPEDRR